MDEEREIGMKRRARILGVGSLAILVTATVGFAASISEHWNGDQSQAFDILGRNDGSATSNVVDAEAKDGRALRLTLDARPAVGPIRGPSIESKARYQYGTFTSRLKTADCSAQGNAGVVTGFFTYFNDGETDDNKNGLPDNSEIDFEWLCAAPQEIYLTMWTDYRDSDAAHRRVMRYIDLRTGTIKKTCYFERFGWSNCQALTDDAEALPRTIPAMTDYEPHKKYYEVGFTWLPGQVTWWIVDPRSGERIILWDYKRADRIPDNPATYMTNIWHTNSWYPLGMNGARRAPRRAISQFVDWTSVTSP